LQTALFHINPVKIGYRRFDYGKCVIYSKQASVEIEQEEFKAALLQCESAFGLSFRARVRLILCGSQEEINRYLPFVSRIDRKMASGFAPWPNSIYITPIAKEKYGGLQGILVHELSHILLLQYYGIIKSTMLWKRYEWIPEGFAIFYAKWPIYLARDALGQALSDAGIDMSNGELLGNKNPKQLSLPVRFMIYYYFIDYLQQKNDESQLARFLKRACANPRRVEQEFKESFDGSSLSDYVKAFAASLARQ
jgi:hypothetical protein